MNHFHNQETELLKQTSKKTFIGIFLISVFFAFAYTNAHAEPRTLSKAELQKCDTIKVLYIKNGMIEADSIDEFTLNLPKSEAIKKSFESIRNHKYDFWNNKNNCTIDIKLS